MEQYGRQWKEPSWSFWRRRTEYFFQKSERKTILWKKWRREARAWEGTSKYFQDRCFEWIDETDKERRLTIIWMIYFLLLTGEIMIFFIFK